MKSKLRFKEIENLMHNDQDLKTQLDFRSSDAGLMVFVSPYNTVTYFPFVSVLVWLSTEVNPGGKDLSRKFGHAGT